MRLQDWSGDWIGLPEAAKIASKAMGADKTEEDIIKLGYLEYPGIDLPLKIYSFVRTTVQITAAETVNGLWGEPLSEAGKKATSDLLTTGDIFELNWGYLEKIALLRQWNSALGGVALTALSVEELPGWESDGRYWKASFFAHMDPAIEILWDDLRVDRQELLVFLDLALKAMEAGVDQTNRPNPQGVLTPIARVAWKIVLFEKIREIDRHYGHRADVTEVIRWLKKNGGSRIIDDDGVEQIIWIDDLSGRHSVTKKTVSSELSALKDLRGPG